MPRLISQPVFEPSRNPFYDARNFDLDYDPNRPDDVELAKGALKNYEWGLRALDGNDRILGSSDDELMNGNQGRDSLAGGGGDDFLRGGKGDDDIFGEEGADILNGNFDNDIVDGGLGDDIVRGGQGDDFLRGRTGNDILIGDYGKDDLQGDAGADLFVMRTETALGAEGNFRPEITDWILDFSNADGDAIGLTNGLDEDDLEIFWGDDFDRNGIADTTIQIESNGKILAVVLDTNPGDLRFSPVTDSLLAVG